MAASSAGFAEQSARDREAILATKWDPGSHDIF
jgi:hypothetical protein